MGECRDLQGMSTPRQRPYALPVYGAWPPCRQWPASRITGVGRPEEEPTLLMRESPAGYVALQGFIVERLWLLLTGIADHLHIGDFQVTVLWVLLHGARVGAGLLGIFF